MSVCSAGKEDPVELDFRLYVRQEIVCRIGGSSTSMKYHFLFRCLSTLFVLLNLTSCSLKQKVAVRKFNCGGF